MGGDLWSSPDGRPTLGVGASLRTAATCTRALAVHAAHLFGGALVVLLDRGHAPGRMGSMSLPALASGRRLELLTAATLVVADGGLRALTHRAVDREAGVAEGTTSGYFRTRLALMSGLTEHVARLLADTIGALRDRVDVISEEFSGEERIEYVGQAVAEHLVALTADSRLVRVQAELGIEAMRTPQLARVFDISRLEFLRLIADIAERVDQLHAHERAETTAAAFQGVLLAAGLQPPEHRAAWVTRASRQLIDALCG